MRAQLIRKRLIQFTTVKKCEHAFHRNHSVARSSGNDDDSSAFTVCLAVVSLGVRVTSELQVTPVTPVTGHLLHLSCVFGHHVRHLLIVAVAELASWPVDELSCHQLVYPGFVVAT